MIQKTKKLNVPSHKQIVQIKIALVGNIQTGKTSFLSKYIDNQCPNHYQPTLGVESTDKYLNAKNSQIHVTFWDFSGKPDFIEIRNQFYRQCTKIFLFTDLSNKASIDDVDSWIKQIKQGGATCSLTIVGNKSDIKKNIDVSQIAKSNGCEYFQISAKTGQCVQQFMEKVVSEFK